MHVRHIPLANSASQTTGNFCTWQMAMWDRNHYYYHFQLNEITLYFGIGWDDGQISVEYFCFTNPNKLMVFGFTWSYCRFIYLFTYVLRWRFYDSIMEYILQCRLLMLSYSILYDNPTAVDSYRSTEDAINRTCLTKTQSRLSAEMLIWYASSSSFSGSVIHQMRWYPAQNCQFQFRFRYRVSFICFFFFPNGNSSWLLLNIIYIVLPVPVF